MKLSVELLLMSAKCLGRKQSLSHPEEVSLEKYELEAWIISLILKKASFFLQQIEQLLWKKKFICLLKQRYKQFTCKILLGEK